MPSSQPHIRLDDFEQNSSTGESIYRRLKNDTDIIKITEAFTKYYASLGQLFENIKDAGGIEQFIKRRYDVYLPSGKKTPTWVVLMDLYEHKYNGRGKLEQWYESQIVLPGVYHEVVAMESYIIEAMVAEQYLNRKNSNNLYKTAKTIAPPSDAPIPLPIKFIEELDDYPKVSRYYISIPDHQIIYINYSGRQLKVVGIFENSTIYEGLQGNILISQIDGRSIMRESSHAGPIKDPQSLFWFSRFKSSFGVPTVYKLEEIDTRLGEYVPNESEGTVYWSEKRDFINMNFLHVEGID